MGVGKERKGVLEMAVREERKRGLEMGVVVRTYQAMCHRVGGETRGLNL